MQVAAVGERAAVALGQRVDAGAGQRREVQDQPWPLARGERKRVGQHHAALGVAVHDLDGHAVRGAHDLLRAVGARADLVLGQCQPAVDVEARPDSRAGEQRADGDRAALHVAVHQVHALVGLEVDAAGVEADALADERDRRSRRAARTAVTQPHDAGAAVRVGARHRKERAGPEPRERPFVVEAEPPALAARELTAASSGTPRSRARWAAGPRASARGGCRRRPRGRRSKSRVRAPYDLDHAQVAGRWGLRLALGHRGRGSEQRRSPALRARTAASTTSNPDDVARESRDTALQCPRRPACLRAPAARRRSRRLREGHDSERVAGVRQPRAQHGCRRVLPRRAIEPQPQLGVRQACDRFLRRRRLEQQDCAVSLRQRGRARRARAAADVDGQLGG